MTRDHGGYESYDYLGDDADSRVALPDSTQPAEPYEVELTDEQAARADALAAESLVVSLHDHPAYLPADVTERPDYLADGRVVTPYDAIAESPLDAVFVSPMGARTWDDAVKHLGMRRCDVAKSPLTTVAETVGDLRAAHETDRVAFVFGFETSTPVGDDLDRYDQLYGLGVRTFGITYSEANALGTGLAEPYQGGLTNFGHDAVERMNALGILVDCSHASDATTRDVCEASDDPVVLSHNGARELHPIGRLDPDDVLEAVADTGGVIGVQAAPHTTASPDHPRHSVESVVDHFDYLVELVGIDHVTFGPDAFYGDHVSLHLDLFEKDLSQFPDWTETDIDGARGIDNPTEGWHNLVRELVKRGYDDDEVRKALGGNTLRVLEEVW
jgi:membrane dipeptidase